MTAIKWSRWSGWEINKLIEMREAGLSVPEIAEVLGRTIYGVNRAIRTRLELEDIQLKTPRWSDEHTAQLISMYREKRCHKLIAQSLNRTQIAVGNRIRYLKILGKI